MHKLISPTSPLVFIGIIAVAFFINSRSSSSAMDAVTSQATQASTVVGSTMSNTDVSPKHDHANTPEDINAPSNEAGRIKSDGNSTRKWNNFLELHRAPDGDWK